MQNKSKKADAVKMAIIGASVAGLAATAYFFLGPKSKKRREHAKAWAIKMKGEVVEKLEMAREMTEPVYQKIIDDVAREYAKGKKASKAEIEALAKDLKAHWKSISKLAMATKQAVKKDTKNISKAIKKTKLR